jgi:DNA-binding transcriptional MerR regulator/methylmalonyl-CoA mutase cobalamin-binding subunit
MNARGSPSSETDEGLLSIGALSTATGIPIDTIRTWERRYGFPVPERKPSGHRVYRLETIPRLRRAAQAIARGHKAAEVVPASERALDALLNSLPELPALGERSQDRIGNISGHTEDLLEALRRFDGERLRGLIHSAWIRLGPLQFLERSAAPFLAAVGSAWATGDLEVRHEHFASGILGDFLRTVRAPIEDRARGPVAALATLPGELHGLGLDMAALVFAFTGWRPVILGVDTPIDQIAALAAEARISAVAVSWVQERTRTRAAEIRALRRALPSRIPLLLGGRGARGGSRVSGVEVLSDLIELDQWLRTRAA